MIWEAVPSSSFNGGLIVTNRRDIALSFGPTGESFAIVWNTIKVPSSLFNSQTSVSFVVDDVPFLDLPAVVNEKSLIINDPRLAQLEEKLKTARTLKIVNPYAVRTLDVAGLADKLDKLRRTREQVAAKAPASGTPPASAPAQAAGGTQASSPADNASSGGGDDFTLEGGVQSPVDKANLMTRRIADLSAQIQVLNGVLEEQNKLRDDNKDQASKDQLDKTVWVISARIADLRKRYLSWNAALNGFLASLKPEERALYVEKPKAQQTVPGFPFVNPDTGETGEFWIIGEVSDSGVFKFNLLTADPVLHAKDDKPPLLTSMTLDDLQQVQAAIGRLYGFSKIAQDQKITQDYVNRIVCFPQAECPAARAKGEPGKVSTELNFVIYSQGKTGGQLLINKGARQEAINFSTDTALVLHSYLDQVIREAGLDQGSNRSQEELDQLFK